MTDNLMPPEPPAEQAIGTNKIGGPVICSVTGPEIVEALSDFTLSVLAGDCASGLTYQWYLGIHGDTANPIPDETSPSFTDSIAVLTNYFVRVTNIHGSFIDSETFEVAVEP